jgi:hypothetical protein
VGLLQSEDAPRALRRFAALLAVATIMLAGLKIPAIVLVVPSWVAAAIVLIRRRQFGVALALAAATAAGAALVTPIAWSDPVNFIITSIEVMSRHAWNGCTLSAGTLMCTHAPDWSAARYLATWYMAQVPIVIGVGALLAIATAPWRGRVQLLVAASLVLPLLLIAARNSTLYDGLRHVLFTIPLMFILATMFWYEMARQTGYRVVLAAAGALGGLFVWDNIAMFPYNYVYFNLPTRMLADDGTFLTDLWGFSLKEAARLPVVDDPNAALIGNPLHLVTPYLAHPHPIMLWPGNVGDLPRPSEAVVVSYVRDLAVPDWCRDPQFVTRRLPMGRTLRMSFAAKCTWK